MPVRGLISKSDRVNVVTWIRSGAPLDKGVSLYAALPFRQSILNELRKYPVGNEEKLIDEMCRLMEMPKVKFHAIIKEYHGKRQSENKRISNTGSENTRSKSVGRSLQSSREEQSVIPRKNNRSFRNDWPFLSRPECPPQLKALAADKISCWERYTAAHKKMFDCSSVEECHQVAHQLMENFKENRVIHDELEYYKQHGAILGQHPIWKQYDRFKDLREKNVIELVRLYEKTLPHRIWRIESEIKKGDKPHLLGEREQRLGEALAELAEIKRILGING